MTDDAVVTACQVSWWEVHEFVESACAASAATEWPVAGTAAWRDLEDTDPAKLAAVLDAGQQRALDLETRDLEARRTYDEWVAVKAPEWALADASRAISEDWAAIRQYMKDEREFYAQKPYLRRKPA